MKSSRRTAYKSEDWLNPQNSPSTGSIVCYDGDIQYPNEERLPQVFVEIADCHTKVRLHQTQHDTKEEFIKKIDKVIDSLSKFRQHLVNKQ